MTHKFKVGDKVRILDPQGSLLEVGSVHTASSVKTFGVIGIEDGDWDWRFDPRALELVETSLPGLEAVKAIDFSPEAEAIPNNDPRFEVRATPYTFTPGLNVDWSKLDQSADSASHGVAEDGAVKSSVGLLPPKVLLQCGFVMGFGTKKYYEGKWLAEPTSVHKRTESAMRHLLEHKSGVIIDPESGQPHLCHAIVQLMMAQEYMNRGIE